MLFIVSLGRSNGITINVNRAHVDKSGQVTPYQEVKSHLKGTKRQHSGQMSQNIQN